MFLDVIQYDANTTIQVSSCRNQMTSLITLTLLSLILVIFARILDRLTGLVELQALHYKRYTLC